MLLMLVVMRSISAQAQVRRLEGVVAVAEWMIRPLTQSERTVVGCIGISGGAGLAVRAGYIAIASTVLSLLINRPYNPTIGHVVTISAHLTVSDQSDHL
jgi:hypothetical protein